MRGRKRTPTARRRLEGNPSGRPLNVAEPKPPPSAEFNTAPLELAGHEVAIAEWTRLAPMLRTAGQVTLADRATLLACCLAWDQYLVAMRALGRSGFVVETTRGDPKGSPWVDVAHKALGACCRLSPELGLTPASRAAHDDAAVARRRSIRRI
jgi:P27 family predicted phage terminase small subunit